MPKSTKSPGTPKRTKPPLKVPKQPREGKRWLDPAANSALLGKFFKENGTVIRDFGQTVNQAFEAFVFSSAIRWYQRRGWTVTIINPDPASNLVRLKYNTRGKPSGYTYARAEKDGIAIQIRHQLRVATHAHSGARFADVVANICADVAIIKDMDLASMKSDDFIPNNDLISFGEAKHMPAFAELVANFIGLVHELRPEFLTLGQRPYFGPDEESAHLAPFLYVSGHIQRTAQGVIHTIRVRGFNIDVFDYRSHVLFGEPAPTILAPKKASSPA